MVFDRTNSLYAAWDGIVENKLKDPDIKISQNHGSDDGLVRL